MHPSLKMVLAGYFCLCPFALNFSILLFVHTYVCLQHDYGHKLVSTVLTANGELVEIGEHCWCELLQLHCLSYAAPAGLRLLLLLQVTPLCFMSATTFPACAWRSM